MHYASEFHFKAAKKVLRYVQGKSDYGVWFQKTKGLKMIGFIDSDWARSSDDMKSTSRYLFTLGFEAFAWNSKK